MLENALIAILFIAALAYLGNLVRRQFAPTATGCAKGCDCAIPTARRDAAAKKLEKV